MISRRVPVSELLGVACSFAGVPLATCYVGAGATVHLEIDGPAFKLERFHAHVVVGRSFFAHESDMQNHVHALSTANEASM